MAVAFTDKPLTIEIHLSNEVCRRNRNCAKFEHLSGLSVVQYNRVLGRSGSVPDAKISRLLRNALGLTELFPGKRFILSMGLESNYNKAAALNLYNFIRANWPYEIAYNPEGRSYHGRIAGTLHELHGYAARGGAGSCITNGDGNGVAGFGTVRRGPNFTLQETRRWARANHNCIRLLWLPGWQGFFREQRGFTRPDRRRFKFDSKDIALMKKVFKGELSYE